MKKIFFIVALATFLSVPSVVLAQCFQYKTCGSCQYYQRQRFVPRLIVWSPCTTTGSPRSYASQATTTSSPCSNCPSNASCSTDSCSGESEAPSYTAPSCSDDSCDSCEYVPSAAGNIPVERRDQQLTLIERLNAARARFSLPALTFDQSLESGASIQASICSRFGRLVHGYGVAEILAQNTSDFDVAVVQWLKSPAHRALLLSGSFRRCGIGVVRDDYGRVWYAVQFR